MRGHRFFAALVTVALVSGANVQAGEFNEASLGGDFSNNRSTPTVLPQSLAAGSNLLRGQYGSGDLDYVTVTVPPHHRLSAIIVGNSTTLGDSRSFIGVQKGESMSVDPNAESAAGLLGWAHIGFGEIGADILDDMAQGFGATGFVPPGPGAYTFWIQELSPGAFSYALDMQVTADPPLAAKVSLMPNLGLSVFALALSVIGTRFRRR